MKYSLYAMIFLLLAATVIGVECGDTIYEDTVLDGDMVCSGTGLWIDADNILLDCNGHSIRGEGFTALKIFDRRNIAIKNCNIINFYNGVEIFNEGNVTIDNNSFYNITNNAIYATQSIYNTYSNNEFISCHEGIGLSESDENKILDNHFQGSFHAIFVLNSDDMVVARNTFEENDRGMRIMMSNYGTIYQNTLENGYFGIDISDCSGYDVVDNDIRSYNYAIKLITCQDSKVRKNDVDGDQIDGMGIAVGVDSSGNYITDNHVYNYFNTAMSVQTSHEPNYILGNEIDSNTHNGFFLMFAENQVIRENNIHDNEEGLGVYFSNSTEIINNRFMNNGNAVELTDSRDTVINSNHFGPQIEFAILPFGGGHNIEISDNVFTGGETAISNPNPFSGLDITGNEFMDYDDAINIENIDDGFVGFNFFTNNNRSINVDESPNFQIVGNDMSDGEDGIFLRMSPGAEVKDNVISDMIDEGINLLLNDDAIISDNIITNCHDGILLEESSGNELTRNTIEGNEIGINMYEDNTYNTIWNNTFDNAQNAYESADSNSNSWDYRVPGEFWLGNLWSDFEENEGYHERYVVDGPGDGVDERPIGGFRLRSLDNVNHLITGTDGLRN